MGAQNLQMPGRREIAGAAPSADLDRGRLSSEPTGFSYWTGISGRRYVHTVYSLLGCPVLPEANYVLVHRDAAGRREGVVRRAAARSFGDRSRARRGLAI